MSEIWIAVLIAFAPGIIAFLYKLLNIVFGFSFSLHGRTDLDVAVTKHDINNQKVEIKIAYAGSSPLIIRRIELTSILSQARGKERFLSWFQLARGYLTDDWEGLQTVFGQKFGLKESIWLRKTVNIILGILFCLLILSLLFNPFGWIILFLGPYNNLRIISSNVNTKVMPSTDKVLPFLIKLSEESELLVEYTFAVKSRLFAPTEAKYIQKRNIPEKSPWKLPRPGQFVLQGDVKLRIKTSGLLATYSINLGKRKFVLIPS